MPRRKTATPKAAAGEDATRDVEAYTHDTATRANNPPVGMAAHPSKETGRYHLKTCAHGAREAEQQGWTGRRVGGRRGLGHGSGRRKVTKSGAAISILPPKTAN